MQSDLDIFVQGMRLELSEQFVSTRGDEPLNYLRLYFDLWCAVCTTEVDSDEEGQLLAAMQVILPRVRKQNDRFATWLTEMDVAKLLVDQDIESPLEMAMRREEATDDVDC